MAPQDILTALRDQNPLVHCITNYVAMNIAANVVLAAGASPAMVHAPEEIPEFTPICGALTVNIGTLSSAWLASMTTAATVAGAHNIPWVLDPVAHFISDYRKAAAQDLLALRARPVPAKAPTAATVWTPRNRLQTRWRRSGAPWWRSPGRSIMSPTARKPRRFRAARP